jgi:hypothetical protein
MWGFLTNHDAMRHVEIHDVIFAQAAFVAAVRSGRTILRVESATVSLVVSLVVSVAVSSRIVCGVTCVSWDSGGCGAFKFLVSSMDV